jgi:hypothetical protein
MIAPGYVPSVPVNREWMLRLGAGGKHKERLEMPVKVLRPVFS